MEFVWISHALAVGCVLGLLYLGASVVAVRRFAANPPPRSDWHPPVTLLKPLCGDEPDLYQNLRSFCEQDYPDYQVVFGVTDPEDPSIEVVRRLMRDLPETDLTLVSDGAIRGRNLKVGSLENMMRAARHDVLVVTDSDIRVGRDYLAKIVPALQNPEVGLVTCLFAARSAPGFWSRLGTMWFNYGFMPSVLVSRLLRAEVGCFGSTMALGRECLDRMGGFGVLRDHLADDYALGAAVRREGRRVVLSTYLVESTIADTSFRTRLQQEVRWSRTIRSVEPLGYVASVITNPVALAALGSVFAGLSPLSLLILAVALAVRLWTNRAIGRAVGLRPVPPWLVPLRDLLSFVVFVVGLGGSRVVWRRQNLRVVPGGRLVGARPTAAHDSAPIAS